MTEVPEHPPLPQQMTEAEARAVLCAFVETGDIEPWIAARRWKATAGGWVVTGELQGWRFRLETVPSGMRMVASTLSGGEPAAWSVPKARR